MLLVTAILMAMLPVGGLRVLAEGETATVEETDASPEQDMEVPLLVSGAGADDPWEDTQGKDLVSGASYTGKYVITDSWEEGDLHNGNPWWSDHFTLKLTSGVLRGYTGTFRCTRHGVNAGQVDDIGSYTAVPAISKTTVGGVTMQTVTWTIRCAAPDRHSDRQTMEVVGDYSYSRELSREYYTVLRKVDEKGEPMNDVTFDLYVNDDPVRNSSWNQVYTGWDYDYTATEQADRYTDHREKEPGYSVIRLGIYEERPEVYVQENWTSDRYKALFPEKYELRTYTSRDAALAAIADGSTLQGSHTWINQEEEEEPVYYYTSIWKTDRRNTGRSLEGTVYGLFDHASCSADHLVVSFVMGKEGYADSIRTDGGEGVFYSYIQRKQAWNIRTVYRDINGVQHDQRLLCLNRLTEDKEFYYKELKAPQGFAINDEVIPVKPVKTKEKITDGADFATAFGTGYVVKAGDNPSVYLKLRKASADPGIAADDPYYSLEGTTYYVFRTREDAEKALASSDYGKAIDAFKIDALGESTAVDVSDYMQTDPDKGWYEDTPFYLLEGLAGKNYQRSEEITEVIVTRRNTSDMPKEVVVENEPLRGKLSLTKLGLENGQGMEGVSFLLERLRPAEEEKDIEVIDTAELFTGKDGQLSTVDAEGEGVLLYGNYRLTEQSCEANAGRQLNPPEYFTIDENTPEVLIETGQGGYYNAPEAEISTKAYVESTGDHKMVWGDREETIIDEVTCRYLRAGTEYTLIGRLMIKKTDGSTEPYRQDGKVLTVEETFTTEKEYEKSPYEVTDIRKLRFEGIIPEDYPGCSFVVYQRLYYGRLTDPENRAAAEREKEAGDQGGRILSRQYEDVPCSLFPVLHEQPDNSEQTVEVTRPLYTSIQKRAKDEKVFTNKAYTFDRILYGLYGPDGELLAKAELESAEDMDADRYGRRSCRGIIPSEDHVEILKEGLLVREKDGYVSVCGRLPEGCYWQEISGNSFFILSDEKLEVTFAKGECLSVTEAGDQPEMGELRVHKELDVEEADPSGAVYLVEGISPDGSNGDIRLRLTIGADGYSESAILPFGEYRISEEKGPDKGEWTIDSTRYLVKLTPDGGEEEVASGIQVDARYALIHSRDYTRVRSEEKPGPEKPETPPDVVQTGDDFPAGIMLFLLILSAVGAGVTLILIQYRRKRIS